MGKLDYVQGKDRPKVDCILCCIRDNDPRVKSLKVYQDDLVLIVLNLYPYNPGHLMVVPKRHILKFVDLTKEEIVHFFRTIQGLQLLLDSLYNPKGYNVGMNQAREAGASIEHLHFHIVPRFGSELGYIDIVGNTRVVPEGVESVKKKIDANLGKYINENWFKSF